MSRLPQTIVPARRATDRVASWSLVLGLFVAFASRGLAQETEKTPTWAAMLDAAAEEPTLTGKREKLIAAARRVAERPIARRVYTYEDVGKHRTWLDGRAKALEGSPRQKWFALAMSDTGTCRTINEELPLLAVAYRLTGDEVFRDRIVAQLEEAATWSPLQRPGWTLYSPSPQPVPADFNDGNWLATGLGVRGLADTLEIMPPESLPPGLVEKIRSLLAREIANIADDWRSKRSWFIRGNNPRTNQWVLPTEGLVRACLVLGKENHPEEYELGVKNLLAALDAQGPEGEFNEGIGYANFTVESMLHAAHAMAAVGDRRAMDHPFLRRFPGWMVQHLQPGRFRINCFDAGGAKTPAGDGSFRRLLSLFVVLTGNPVARWALENQFTGPSDDFVGLLAGASSGPSREPRPFAHYGSATRVNWRSSWADNATGVWVRGGHRLDGHDHHDRGHVNFIYRGKPILIEAGTPSYDNPRIHTLYSTVIGHNVLEIPGSPARKAPAAITADRLDESGGDVQVDPTAGYPAVSEWHRRVTWDARHVEVVDRVVFPPQKPAVGVFRWHLGTQEEVEIEADGARTTVSWPDAEMTLDSSVPVAVTTRLLPDNTVNLGEKVGPDYLHRSVEVQTAAPAEEWTLRTTVAGTP